MNMNKNILKYDKKLVFIMVSNLDEMRNDDCQIKRLDRWQD